MFIEEGYLYHIYNQGNNNQKIFFNDENYLFFLNKIKVHILPHADILAWCLMPNHFHLMVSVNQVELPLKNICGSVISHNNDPITQGLHITKTRTLNSSIAIILRSYTRAINKQNNTSGSLFRQKTKSECLNCFKGITPSFIGKDAITQINTQNPENEYPNICFNYIHQNPVKAGLVRHETDWRFSSAKDYFQLRNGKIVNKILAKELELI